MCWIPNKVIWLKTRYKYFPDDFTKKRPYLIINEKNNQGIVELVVMSSVQKRIELGFALYNLKTNFNCLKKKPHSHLKLDKKLIFNLNNPKLLKKNLIKCCLCCQTSKECLNDSEYQNFLLKFNQYQSNEDSEYKFKIIDLTNYII